MKTTGALSWPGLSLLAAAILGTGMLLAVAPSLGAGYGPSDPSKEKDDPGWTAQLKPEVNPDLAGLGDNTWKLMPHKGDAFDHPKTEVGLVYDEDVGCVVYFAGCSMGYTNNVWLYHVGSNTWKKAGAWTTKKEEESDRPVGQCGYTATYNSDLKLFFKHRGAAGSGLGRGGRLKDSNTWSLDVRTLKWEKLVEGPHDGGSDTWPATYIGYGLVYDRDVKQAILFGGDLPETWAFDFTAKKWSNLKAQGTPPTLYMPNMVYDTKNKVIIAYGGGINGYNGKTTDETWAYDHAKNTWENRKPAVSPPPRMQSQACYDSVNGVMILFGGHVSNYPTRLEGKDYLDTWVYDYKANAWTEMKPAAHPQYAWHLRYMAFDPVNNVAINVVRGEGGYNKNTWAYRYKRATGTEKK